MNVLKVRYIVQRYIGSGGWTTNIDIKLQGESFKTIEDARHAAKLAQRRYKAVGRKPMRMRINVITTEVYEEL